MTPTVILLADGFGELWQQEYAAALHAPLARALLHDTITSLHALRNTRILLRYGAGLSAKILANLPQPLNIAPLQGKGANAVAEALRQALATNEPAVLIGAVTPHLPLWRVRDAFTHLGQGADLVLGPSSGGDWYLLGLCHDDPELLGRVPARFSAPTDLLATARSHARRVALLPPWFELSRPGDLAALAEVLQHMPANCAPQTRALLEQRFGQSRAVGG